jgi:apolipoprotein N-acyltransferase
LGLGAASGLFVVFGCPFVSIFLFIKSVSLARRSTKPERLLSGWAFGYMLVSASWLFPALSFQEAVIGFGIVGILAGTVYGLPGFLLRSSATAHLWPIVTALAELCAANAGYSMAPIGLWGVESGIGYIIQMGSIYYATTVICFAALFLTKHVPQKPKLISPLLVSIGALFLVEPTAAQKTINVVGISTNPDAVEKWTLDGSQKYLASLETASKLHQSADLIVWPENAITTTFHLDEALKSLKPMKTPLIFGMTRYHTAGEPSLLNSAVLWQNDTVQTSDKILLVPIHESGLLGLLPNQVEQGVRNILTLQTGQRLLPLICYEVAFPIPKKDLSGVDVIIVISAETGFQQKFASNIMSLHAKARSLESGIPVIRISDSGRI